MELHFEKDIKDSFRVSHFTPAVQPAYPQPATYERLAYHRILFVQEGSGVIEIDDVRFELTGRELFLLSKGQLKNKIIPTFFSGFAHKTDTTFGNIKADVCAYMIPNFERKNFCDCILHSPWAE